MSQTKVQLIAPIGVVTATTLETTGVLTATTFVGDIAGTVTGITSTTDNLNLGIITATSFAGDFTGIGSGLTGTPNVVAGVVTATKFVGNTPGTVSGIADGTNINAGIITATSFVGNITGNAAGLSTTTAQVTLGIVTATSYHGSGANLDGVSSGPVAQQAVTANSSTTTIDLSSGNIIYMTQSANTTVAFANTEGNTDVVYLIRVKDATATERTITWPSGMVWDGGSEPTILQVNDANEAQTFKLTTRDNGATWYGSEVFNNSGGKELWTWGKNHTGQLGQNSTTYYSSPVQIPGAGWDIVHSGYDMTMARKNDGTLWAWGKNGAGGLGQNTVGNPSDNGISSPVQIPGTTWASAKNSNNSVLAKKTDGTLWAWGNGWGGGLGQNQSTTEYSSPVQIGSDTTWNEISKTPNMSFSIKTDGTLWAWGHNGDGPLGQNNRTQYSSPVQIPGTTWSKVDSGHSQFMATKTDGTLWMCGNNHMGGLGQNNTTKYSSPVQIPGTTWNNISSGNYCSHATKTDGTLWGWGVNAHGNLGQNNRTHYSSPVQVPGTSWVFPVATYNSVFASKTDGTLWAIGGNDNGTLSQNNRTYYSSPVQIPGTDWVNTVGKWGAEGARGLYISVLKNP